MPTAYRPSNRDSGGPLTGPWHPEADGAVAADAGTLRLVVHPHTPGGYARFLVLRDLQPGPDASPRSGRALLASGTETSVPAAMQAAERAAARLTPRKA